MDINFVRENLVTDNLDNVAGHSLMGYFRMFYNGGWFGKWFAIHEDFKQDGLLNSESTTLKNFCEWVQNTFIGGCDDKMLDYLSNNEDIQNINSNYFIGLRIDDTSYAVVKYTPRYGNEDYPIRIYLYRKDNDDVH